MAFIYKYKDNKISEIGKEDKEEGPCHETLHFTLNVLTCAPPHGYVSKRIHNKEFIYFLFLPSYY